MVCSFFVAEVWSQSAPTSSGSGLRTGRMRAALIRLFGAWRRAAQWYWDFVIKLSMPGLESALTLLVSRI
ncbi:hypothetical protein A5651_21780 [Mycobacterium sp. 1274761.0]|nr:hypothetical protein A5651_21780 [Mycobacterium sp. 1274761.0]